ncbi:MAG TPA: branched-chain amino acid ABC transporter permease [Syntrophobacteraceae bacterium]|nr:branched-chain amino acid ABC transporter permease [Syntrophobacteraceae bacterium]
MNPVLLLVQGLNGIQYGIMLFLMAAGLTLVFGVMNLLNLAHGSFYMLGAYLAATLLRRTGSFALALGLALPITAVIGIAIELLIIRKLYERSHLDQVLATFALILSCNELVRLLWGAQAYFMALPDHLAGQLQILPGVTYPVYRLVIIAVGLTVALGLYLLIMHTRLGMLIRAGASNREMVSALGVNVRLLFTVLFGIGAALAGLAGMIAGPILSVEVGMGDHILVLTLVVVVIGGIGSIRGAFLAAILVGVADTFGRVMLPPALASMVIYLLMAALLCWRPQGLFPAHG